MEAIRLPINRNDLSWTQYNHRKNFIDFVKEYLDKSHRSDRYKKIYLNTIDYVTNNNKRRKSIY